MSTEPSSGHLGRASLAPTQARDRLNAQRLPAIGMARCLFQGEPGMTRRIGHWVCRFCWGKSPESHMKCRDCNRVRP